MANIPMAIIEKKCWPEYFEKVLQGTRTFDVRLDDFEVKAGDTFVLREYDHTRKRYTGRSIAKKVGYVMKFKPYAIPLYLEEDIEKEGLQIISLLDKKNEP